MVKIRVYTDLKDFYSTAGLKDIIGNRQTVHRLIKEGKLRADIIEGRTLISRSEVERYLKIKGNENDKV
jgi:predicted site-specific integrase-resolvase